MVFAVSSDDSAKKQDSGELVRTHDDAGVDLTQIDLMLAMTPRQRLDALYTTASSLARLMRDADRD
jgi:hypothetical protein